MKLKHKSKGQTMATQTENRMIRRAVNEGVIIIEDAAIEVAILSDDSTVISRRSLFELFGRKPMKDDNDGLIALVSAKHIKPFVTDKLRALLTIEKIEYINKRNNVVQSYNVAVVPHICHAYVKAGLSDVNLNVTQWNTIYRAEVIYQSLGELGMVGLVRERFNWKTKSDEPLVELLAMILAKTVVPHYNEHGEKFFNEVCRLKDWDYEPDNKEQAKELTEIANNVVHSRIGLEFQNKIKAEDGLSKELILAELSHPKLVNHLNVINAFMSTVETWDEFIKMLDKAFPIKVK